MDYFTHVCEVIEFANEKQAEEAMCLIDTYEKGLCPEEYYPDGHDYTNLGLVAIKHSQEPKKVFFQDDESVTADNMAGFMKMLQDRFNLGPIYLNFAWTGSKHAPDTFGGAACAIRPKKEVVWTSTIDWIHDRMAEDRCKETK